MDLLEQIKFILKSPMFLWTLGLPLLFFILVDGFALMVPADTYLTVVYVIWTIIVLVIFLSIFVSAAPHFVTAREVEYLEAHKALLYPGLDVHFDEQEICAPYLTRVMMSVGGHRKGQRRPT